MVNVLIANDYVLECQPYEYMFFQVPEEDYPDLEAVLLDVDVESQCAQIVLNEYLPARPKMIQGSQILRFSMEECEAGENILAYKGQIRLKEVRFLYREKGGTHSGACEGEKVTEGQEVSVGKAAFKSEDSVQDAARFLLNSRIQHPDTSQFQGSCYAIYDYTNQCHRMPCWLWSDAPVAYAMLQLGGKECEQLAMDIGEVLLHSQVTDPKDPVYGALLSRYRYYGRTNRSFHRLLGLNDTSYSVKWALLPLYEKTGDKRYLEASRIALDWIEKNIYEQDFIPSHYYYEDKVWEDRAFVDTGFCVEGFEQYQKIAGDRDYRKTMDYLMRRFMKQFQLETGYFGQNYFPGKGVDDRLFTRGHAWVLEGLLSCCRALGGNYYKKEARGLCEKLIRAQRPDGAWSYLLGYGTPDPRIMEGSGICEKATAILAYLFLEYYRLYPDENVWQSAMKALAWCEENMVREPGLGFGGIPAQSLSSGITGLPFLKVATGYGNAYYILAKILKGEIDHNF